MAQKWVDGRLSSTKPDHRRSAHTVAGVEEPVEAAATAGKSDYTLQRMKAAGFSGLFYLAARQGVSCLDNVSAEVVVIRHAPVAQFE
jgi:hypothetical protein